MKHFATLVVVLLALTTLASAQQAITPQLPQTNLSFVCNTGYSLQRCHEQVTVLRSVVDKYSAHQLGPWTWVLVRSEDWKPILLARRLDPDSPAFSFLEERETFIEEALFADNVQRRVELLKKWQLPVDRLLELAVTHELGHALCNTLDEAKADRYGKALRERKPAMCEVPIRK